MKFKSILACLILLSIFMGCEKKEKDNNSATKSPAQKLMEDHFKFLNDHNLKALRTQYTANAYVTSPDNQGAQPGPLGADEVFHHTFLLSSNMQYIVSNMMTNDTSAVVQYEVRGSKTRENPNSIFIYKGCSIFKIQNNKISSEMIYANPSIDVSNFMNRGFR